MQVKLPSSQITGKTRLPVSDVVSRVARIKKISWIPTYGDAIGGAITRLAGDTVKLDDTERLLVEFKRRKVITGRKMVHLLGKHLRERDVRG